MAARGTDNQHHIEKIHTSLVVSYFIHDMSLKTLNMFNYISVNTSWRNSVNSTRAQQYNNLRGEQANGSLRISQVTTRAKKISKLLALTIRQIIFCATGPYISNSIRKALKCSDVWTVSSGGASIIFRRELAQTLSYMTPPMLAKILLLIGRKGLGARLFCLRRLLSCSFIGSSSSVLSGVTK